MKRGLLILSILFLSLLIIPFAVADETEDINKAYECLEGRVENQCLSLSSEARIFSLLAIEECENEVISDSKNDECWPNPNCNIKTTAQAILALDKVSVDTNEAEEWLLSQNTTHLDLTWYLEIENTETISDSYSCTINYSDSSNSITIGLDKKISSISGAGTCLSLSNLDPSTPADGYWLEISSSCYAQEFEISCDKGFLTTLLYRKQDFSTIYISEDINEASAGGKTTEKINSFCFKQGGSCNYEGSLWAALVLDYLDPGYDVSPYLPYLVTMASENTKYLPDSFLYYITNKQEFLDGLLNQQISDEYWKVSDDKFYDTALALFPLYYESYTEKTNAKNWLLDVQGTDGCWNSGHIRDTAFILYSVWPKELPVTNGNGDDELDCIEEGYFCMSAENCSDTILYDYICSDEEDICCGDAGGIDCEDAGYYCMSSMSCEEAEGDVLDDYDCFGVNICCTKDRLSRTCVEDLDGEICSSSDNCVGGVWEDASDLDYGQRCCVGGTCAESGVSDCEYYEGTCRTSCEDDEEENNDECDYSGDVCCVEKTTPPEPKSYWWLWVLLSLIVLTILGIIFRDKLRPFWLRIKRSKPSKPGFILPPRTTRRRAMPRRILPPTQKRPITRAAPHHPAPRPKPKGEIDDVLKKLKEMGK